MPRRGQANAVSASPPSEVDGNTNLGRSLSQAAASAPKPWFNDFRWEDGHLVIKKTGIRLRLNLAVLSEILNWAGYLAILAIASMVARMRRTPEIKLWFAPDRPRPWYLIRGAAIWGGMVLAQSAEVADAVFYFDDTTYGHAPALTHANCFNWRCTDISKSHVARIFEEVFGYALTVSPLETPGEIVEKPETNGVHGGRIVKGPCVPRPGYVYQRVVDTKNADGCCQDLRAPCAGGEPVLVWIKTKTPEGRFSINNRRAVLTEPTALFSKTELRNIREFNARMGLDWGGLDILRDRTDGRIYIVDVNKTDLGPVVALSWRDKIASMNRLSAALQRLVGDAAFTEPGSPPRHMKTC